MSAYIVEIDLIDGLLTYVKARAALTPQPLSDEDATMLGNALLAENYRSVFHRYQGRHGTTGRAPVYAFCIHPLGAELPPHAILKACDCLEYQSCETDDYDQTPAYRTLRCIKRLALIAAGLPEDTVRYTDADAYKTAPWGMIENPSRLHII